MRSLKQDKKHSRCCTVVVTFLFCFLHPVRGLHLLSPSKNNIKKLLCFFFGNNLFVFSFHTMQRSQNLLFRQFVVFFTVVFGLVYFLSLHANFLPFFDSQLIFNICERERISFGSHSYKQLYYNIHVVYFFILFMVYNNSHHDLISTYIEYIVAERNKKNAVLSFD